jgi:hypothetical protein
MILIILIILIIFFLFIYNYIDANRYMYINSYSLFSLDHDYKYKRKIKNCVISLTTTPGIISKLRPILISLLDQSYRVEEIRINVPYNSCKGEKYIIPKWLKKLKHVKIYRTIKDWGPATKLIPTLLNCKNKKIIVVDDDVIYGYYTVETLNNYFEKFNKKHKTAITMYGDVIDEKCNTENGLTTRIMNYVTGHTFTDLLRGHSAYMVTPDMFTEKLYDYTKIPKECFYVDDNYFSAHLKKNNVKILMIGMSYKAVPLPEMTSCAIGALHGNENHNGKNERVVNKFFK